MNNMQLDMHLGNKLVHDNTTEGLRFGLIKSLFNWVNL